MPKTHRARTAAAPAAAQYLVALGASAGGLAPLIEVLAGLPAGLGLAVFVVQHLAPDQVSALPALLQPHTGLQVVDASDGLAILADHVYVIRPATALTVSATQVLVSRAAAQGGSAHRIDALFQSAAQAFGARAAAVVLSGMGNDGSAGLRAILDHGGQALAQLPETAQFDSMPRCAAAIAHAVQVAAPAELPTCLLAALLGPAATPAQPAGPPEPPTSAQWLARVVALLAGATGHDFSQYKTSTLERRIERRMAIHGSASLADYVRLLGASTQEAELLFKEMLIGVTAFFRDPPLWQSLAQTALPALLDRAAARPDGKLRAWVVACSTGEEAYSLGMLLAELQDSKPAWRGLAVQIFATDLSADAIQVARRGLYTAAACEAMPLARRERFFVPDGSGLRVGKALREMVLFARHDVIADAPFSRVDLVSCRNLLIYFKAPLQQRILALFHYVLRPGGLLLLGNAESAGRLEALFPPVDTQRRIFCRDLAQQPGVTTIFPVKPAAMSPNPPPEDTPQPAPSAAPLQTLADRLMLDEFSPPAVLVSEAGDILYVSGRTGRYLEPAAGKANWNVHAMAREGLRGVLDTALRQARAEGRPINVQGLVADGGVPGPLVDLAVRPVALAGQGKLLLIVFRELGQAGAGLAAPLDSLDQAQALSEEMRSSQEELQSANEELQSTNEELQSANEELTTSKEEMQAMNEELQTVNGELMSKLGDLALAQGDLKNLLNSTQIATLFLDRSMNVRRFTEQAKKVINLRDSDVGRPLSDLTTALDYPALSTDVAEVLRTLETSEKEIPSHDGRWFAVRVMPYRTLDNMIDGSVVTFTDISAAKSLEARLRQAGAA